MMTVAAPEFFFLLGGIEGAKCDSEGAKIKKNAEIADFGHFFLLTGGGGGASGGRASDWGAFAPMPPFDAATA